MVYNKTKKKNVYHRKKNLKKRYKPKSHKKYIGGTTIPPTNPNPTPKLILNNNNNNNELEENKEKLYNAYQNTIKPVDPNLIERAYTNKKFFGKIGEIIKKGLTNAVDNIGDYVGYDPDDAKSQLIAAQKTLKNTDNLQELAVVGSLVLEAFMPFIDPLLNKLTLYGQEAAEKIGKTIISVILNTAEEVPGYGIIIGTIRSLDNIARTFLSTVVTSAKVIDEIRGGIQFTMGEFDTLKNQYMLQLQKQKNESMNRVQNSIQKFNGGGLL